MPDPLIIQAGTLRHTVTIQASNSTRDAAGEPLDTWNAVLTTRAAIESTLTATYKESFSQNAFSSQSTDLITMRWPGASISIKPGQRVTFNDKTYLIQAVNNVQERNRALRLACIQIDGASN